jgi:hypothetical protein
MFLSSAGVPAGAYDDKPRRHGRSWAARLVVYCEWTFESDRVDRLWLNVARGSRRDASATLNLPDFARRSCNLPLAKSSS